ncbi:hypothetical protein [Nocardia sp. NPDC049707]|uniref:hypothetical protein n=1 Tax=Nocardia sp. NPDC049707 TaxID=3154735 RepID=UPI003429C7B8
MERTSLRGNGVRSRLRCVAVLGQRTCRATGDIGDGGGDFGAECGQHFGEVVEDEGIGEGFVVE